MKTVKTYPAAVEAERQLLLSEAEKHWETVRAECRCLPPEAVKARIDRAREIELSVIYRRLVDLESKANLSMLMTPDEAKAAGALFPAADH